MSIACCLGRVQTQTTLAHINTEALESVARRTPEYLAAGVSGAVAVVYLLIAEIALFTYNRPLIGSAALVAAVSHATLAGMFVRIRQRRGRAAPIVAIAAASAISFGACYTRLVDLDDLVVEEQVFYMTMYSFAFMAGACWMTLTFAGLGYLIMVCEGRAPRRRHASELIDLSIGPDDSGRWAAAQQVARAAVNPFATDTDMV